MSASPLIEEEVWLLRCIDKYCYVPGRDCAVRILRYHVLNPATKEILARMDYRHFRTLALGLREYGFIGTSFHNGGGDVWITPEGRGHIHKIDHPDLVEKARQSARLHPMGSRLIIVCKVLVPLAALGTLVTLVIQWRGCLSQ